MLFDDAGTEFAVTRIFSNTDAVVVGLEGVIGVAADDALLLQPMNAAADRRAGKRDLPRDLFDGHTGIFGQQAQDLLIEFVHEKTSLRRQLAAANQRVVAMRQKFFVN